METLGTIPISSLPGVTGGLGVEMAFPERTVVTLVRIVFKSYFSLCIVFKHSGLNLWRCGGGVCKAACTGQK